MPKTDVSSLYFPVGGVVRRHGFQRQAPYTTPDAMNVWPTDWTSGRERGGTRPGLTTAGTLLGTGGAKPYGWSEANWVTAKTPATPATNNVLRRGVAVAVAAGCQLYDGTTWDNTITGKQDNDFSSCTVFLNTLYLAIGGQSTEYKILGDAPKDPDGNDRSLGPAPLYSDLYSGVLDSSGVALVPQPAKGTPPTGCGIVVTWQDRLVLGGDTLNPNQLYMSASGNPYNWDYTVVGRGAAWYSGGTNGQINEPITSLIPHGDDCMLIGCTDSMYTLRGNPTGGGYRASITKHLGPLMQTAWCKDEKNRSWFLSRRGLYMVPAGCGSPPESISAEVIPDDLVGVDPAAGDFVSLSYDMRWRMIHIYITKAGGAKEYWAYDMQSGGFWPMDFGTTKIRMGITYKAGMTTELSDMRALTDTGGVRTFDRDSTEAISSYVWYGPIQLGGPMERGGLLTVSGALAAPGQTVGATLTSTQGRISYDVYVGDSALQAFSAMSAALGTWNVNGWNYPKYVRRAGQAVYIKLSSVSSKPWSIEEVVIERVPAGRRRVTA